MHTAENTNNWSTDKLSRNFWGQGQLFSSSSLCTSTTLRTPHTSLCQYRCQPLCVYLTSLFMWQGYLGQD